MRQSPFRRASTFLLLCTAVLPACASFLENEYVGESTYRLRERAEPDGVSVSYELRVEPTNDAYLDIVRESDEAYIEVGLQIVEIDRSKARELAERQPFDGMLIRKVDQDSPAYGKVRPGEVLVSVGGKKVIYTDELEKALSALQPGTPALLEVRAAGADSPTRKVELVPEVRTRRVRKMQRVRMEGPEVNNPKPYAGVGLRRFPPQFTREVFDRDEPVLVISGVALGSPAYLAGLRAGDLILQVDGRPVPEMSEVQRMLREKGPREEVVVFDVRSQLGEYRAEVELEDYSGSSSSSLWLVWKTSSSARRTVWNFLLGGWLVGYENQYEQSRTRSVAERGHFTMLLGLFKREWSPGASRTRLLWFINFQ